MTRSFEMHYTAPLPAHACYASSAHGLSPHMPPPLYHPHHICIHAPMIQRVPDQRVVVDHGVLVVALVVRVKGDCQPVPPPGGPVCAYEVVGGSYKGSRGLTQVY